MSKLQPFRYISPEDRAASYEGPEYDISGLQTTDRYTQFTPKGMINDTGQFIPYDPNNLPAGIKPAGGSGEFAAGQGFDNANRFVMENLAGLATTGTASLNIAQGIKIKSKAGLIKNMMNGDLGEPDDDDLPVGPGTTYLTHLFKYNGVREKMDDLKKKVGGGANIYTDQQEALMTALNVVGLYSDKNPGGMPIDVQEALKLKFGNTEVDDVQKSEFMSIVENGDSKIDPKRIRKFVNYDGSLTWEVLNEDKTVMSRFTMGKYNGTSIFAQGGYKKFAELLKKAKSKLGKDTGGEFDSIRSMFGE